jgi:hypothetical protein
MALLAATPAPVTRIATNAASCAPKNQNLRVTARVDGAPKNVRLYFHAIGPTCGEYYVDMHRDANTPGQYWAVLPIAGADVSAIAAQVKADFGAGAYLPGDSVVVPVTSDCPVQALSPEETRAASNIVLGLTQANQSSIPCAFRCKGVTSFLTTTNELHPNEQCLRLLAAEGNRPPWYKTPAGLGAAAGLLGGAYALGSSSSSKPPPPSPARP